MKDVSDGEINRELQILKRAFSLTIKSGRIAMRPDVPMLEEDDVRTGFSSASSTNRSWRICLTTFSR